MGVETNEPRAETLAAIHRMYRLRTIPNAGGGPEAAAPRVPAAVAGPAVSSAPSGSEPSRTRAAR